MRIIYFTDSHATTSQPTKRLDNFSESIFEKHLEIVNFATKNSVDLIFHGGDFFHRPIINLEYADRLINLFNSNGYDSRNFTVIPGNHDSEKSELGFKRSLIEHYRRMGKLSLLRNEEKVFENSHSNLSLSVLGVDYLHREALETAKSNYHSNFSILIAHDMITNKTVPYEHKLFYNLPRKFDFVLLGHYHYPFSEKIGNTSFINPGALARIRAYGDELERTPLFLFIDFENRNFELIPLECAKPSYDIFPIEEIEKERDLEEKISNFLRELEGTELQRVNLESLIEKLGSELQIDEEVKQEVLQRLERKVKQ